MSELVGHGSSGSSLYVCLIMKHGDLDSPHHLVRTPVCRPEGRPDDGWEVAWETARAHHRAIHGEDIGPYRKNGGPWIMLDLAETSVLEPRPDLVPLECG